MTLTNILHSAPTKELLRAYNSTKGYLYFDISVFNAGVHINIICTDTYKSINYNNWNGYDFIFENCDTTKYYLLEALKERFKNDFDKLTSQQVKRIKKLIFTKN